MKYRFYIHINENGHRVAGGRCLQHLCDEYLSHLHGAVVSEYIRRQNAQAKAELLARRLDMPRSRV